ncbi:indolepyruvate oxidoreductase subunit beta [Alkaliphilus hydrothermalis]|uniref:Indolepyruvate ferredoxin oxidoreductase beta subunit n=1 Tax=Alkaliphilus hydrothermalis TaxID=1482730 RepID=A0ABS2NRE4_9FIRM|nr:indolepyruvate oxidoreductase subunit beta [Alkaliphilus hydrothermalis]MBM7615517.1 indolepyruvate ferredoxin oxidoreductase beta subunit [Alkaliphilus hydrothermalis]
MRRLITNIMLGGVGGQGLILMTKIICQAALKDGYDVKSNDVVGLSQRGGMVWGNIRIGEKIYSPNIVPGDGDILVAMEPLEALRWSSILKPQAKIIMNTKEIYPTMVQQEKMEYPVVAIEDLKDKYQVTAVNAFDEAVKIGKKQVSNVILIGILAKHLDIKLETWKESIANNVPKKAIDMNMDAFDFGYGVEG